MKKIVLTGIVCVLGMGLAYGAGGESGMSLIDEKGNQVMSNVSNPAMNRGELFLQENAKKPGVVTLPSGLQYKIVVEGKGEKPKRNESVTVHYAGTLVDGKEFDSSYKRGQPATFPVGAVIAGWVEALQLMPVGSTWELYIPSNLAYGERGAPPVIGANEALIFKVELLSIKK